MLAKTAGVKHLVVLINKMDDSTVHWGESRCVQPLNALDTDILGYPAIFRFEECKTKLTPFLKKVGFNPKTGKL